MNTIDIEQAIEKKFPTFFTSQPKIISKPIKSLCRKLFREHEINQFLAENEGLEGMDFVDAVLDHFNFTYSSSNADRINIPSTGRVLIVANHPLGAVDGLALLKYVKEIRPDVKMVSTDMLSQLTPLSSLMLPVDNLHGSTTRQNMAAITHELQQEHAVIIFPSGEVSRINPKGIRDSHWKSGFLHFSKQTNAPILPVFLKGKNSTLF